MSQTIQNQIQISLESNKENKKNDNKCFVIDFEKHMIFDDAEKIEKAIIDRLKKFLPKNFLLTKKLVLIVGIGNSQIVEDSFGPIVSRQIEVGNYEQIDVSVFNPDVSGKTNLETYKLVLGVVKEFSPDLVLFIDTLSTNDTNRIASSIQISKSSLVPGSGLGEKGKPFSSKHLKTKSVLIGMPFVKFEDVKGEKFMTTLADIDAIVRQCAIVVSNAVNHFFKNESHKRQ